MKVTNVPQASAIDAKRDRLVIIASTLGTVFEWYDFFVYGTLAAIIAKLFFPSDNATAGLLLALATFGAGFGVRPLGAILFGHLGDRLGRKYTFLVTITLMGVATAAVGILPTYAQAGIIAPALLVVCRLLQGLALGGEYGGAAVYVAEHAPREKRGFYTSFIQAGVMGGFLLSIAVVLASNLFVDAQAWESWGWRLPFLFSLLLLAISLWIRMKLKESPVFKAMQEAGELARNPLRESFNSVHKLKMLMVALWISAGMTVIWYTAQFQLLYFLQATVKIDENSARMLLGAGAIISVFWFVLFGTLSDRFGRKPILITGFALTLLVLFPLFHWISATANPALAEATARAPITVTGSACTYDPFAKIQATPCGKVLDILSKKGLAYSKLDAGPGAAPVVTIGGAPVDVTDAKALDEALATAGYKLEKTGLSLGRAAQVVLAITLIGLLSGMSFGPLAATLVELFPARVRYTSMSVPYHLGTGYFGGFLPFISQYIVAKTGDPLAGLWYTIAIVVIALAVTLIWLPETAGKELD